MFKQLAVMLLTVWCAMGCSSPRKEIFDVTVRNDSAGPITVWLTKDGPPYESKWASPEDLATERPGGSDQYLGVIVPPAKSGSTGPVEARLDRNTRAWLRIYAGGQQFSDLLALSRGNPRRLDVALEPGVNRFVVSEAGGKLAAERVEQP